MVYLCYHAGKNKIPLVVHLQPSYDHLTLQSLPNVYALTNCLVRGNLLKFLGEDS